MDGSGKKRSNGVKTGSTGRLHVRMKVNANGEAEEEAETAHATSIQTHRVWGLGGGVEGPWHKEGSHNRCPVQCLVCDLPLLVGDIRGS